MQIIEIDNIKSQMRKGILEYCVLTYLSRGKGYPSDIIKAFSRTNLTVVEGTIYTLLNRLRREGKLDYEWQESPKGPPRKYFFITGLGRDTLLAMDEAWREISSAVIYFSSAEEKLPATSGGRGEETDDSKVINITTYENDNQH